jgi:hypothetical protein
MMPAVVLAKRSAASRLVSWNMQIAQDRTRHWAIATFV